MSALRERWPLARVRSAGLLLLLLIAVATLTTYTLRTTLQLDQLRQQSVIEAVAALATEKAQRIDRQLIDQDNVIMALAEPSRLEQLAERWLPTANRETPTIRALWVLDASGNVLSSSSRTSDARARDDDEFRRLLVTTLWPELNLQDDGKLRHLHRQLDGKHYLLSYWTRRWEQRRYVVVAWHDIGRIVRETFASALTDTATAAGRINVLDEEGRPIAGPPLRAGAFSVSVQFPTTLYNWRVQVTPTSAEAIATSVEKRRKLEVLMVTSSGAVVLLGVAGLLLASDKQRRLAALKSEFVANVSHELRTPLSLVRMFGELLQSGRGSEEKRREYASIVVRESERLSALIDNVLDFAKLERGKGELQRQELDLGELAAQVCEHLRGRAERAGVTLRLQVRRPLLPVDADPTALELALSNLIDNAIKYGGAEQPVEVHIARRARRIEVRVEDRGPGVPETEKQRIFERFERGEARIGEGGAKVRGTGIGLSLVKHVAQSHGGEVWVEGRADDQPGAQFVLSLPVASRLLARKPLRWALSLRRPGARRQTKDVD